MPTQHQLEESAEELPIDIHAFGSRAPWTPAPTREDVIREIPSHPGIVNHVLREHVECSQDQFEGRRSPG